jgi:hypothetical protein
MTDAELQAAIQAITHCGCPTWDAELLATEALKAAEKVRWQQRSRRSNASARKRSGLNIAEFLSTKER